MSEAAIAFGFGVSIGYVIGLWRAAYILQNKTGKKPARER